MDDQLISFLNENAKQLEKRRIKAVRLNSLYKIIKPLRAILKVLAIILIFINVIVPFILPFTITIGVIYLLLLIIDNPVEVFEYNLKNTVLPKIFKYVNETFKYFPEGYNEETLKKSDLLSKGFFANINKIEGKNYVSGKISNVDVEFFEIAFSKKVVNYTKTAGGCLLSILSLPFQIVKSFFDDNNQIFFLDEPIQDEKIFFSGFFMHADFNKDFKGKIIMIPKQNDKLKDKINELFEQKLSLKINIENPFINDNYNIYVSDIQTGFYVLSQSLIDKIHDISLKEKVFPIISFIDGKMYFSIPWSKKFFKVNISKKIENADYFLPYLKEIDSFEAIVKDLNLDKRIWTKK